MTSHILTVCVMLCSLMSCSLATVDGVLPIYGQERQRPPVQNLRTSEDEPSQTQTEEQRRQLQNAFRPSPRPAAPPTPATPSRVQPQRVPTTPSRARTTRASPTPLTFSRTQPTQRRQNGFQTSSQNGFQGGSQNLNLNRPQNGFQSGSQNGFQNGFQNRPQNGFQTGFQNGFQNRPQNGFDGRSQSGFQF